MIDSIIGILLIAGAVSLIFGPILIMSGAAFCEGFYRFSTMGLITGDETSVDYHGDISKTHEYRVLLSFKDSTYDVFEILDAATAIKAVLDKRGCKSHQDLELYQKAVEAIEKVRKEVVKKVDSLLSNPLILVLLRSYGIPEEKLKPFDRLSRIVFSPLDRQVWKGGGHENTE
jgi:hypothetical protein